MISWRDNEYQKAKDAIEPSGEGLGRGFIQHFLPANSVPNPNNLQVAITAYYQERWREDGQKLLDESQLVLWQAKETNDQEKIDAALELEKQARVLPAQGPVMQQVATAVSCLPALLGTPEILPLPRCYTGKNSGDSDGSGQNQRNSWAPYNLITLQKE